MSQFVALKERRDRVGERRPMKDRVTGDGDGDDGGTGQPGGGVRDNTDQVWRPRVTPPSIYLALIWLLARPLQLS